MTTEELEARIVRLECVVSISIGLLTGVLQSQATEEQVNEAKQVMMNLLDEIRIGFK